MAQGKMAKQTAEKGPSEASGDTFRTLPQKDSRVQRTGYESYGGTGPGQEGVNHNNKIEGGRD